MITFYGYAVKKDGKFLGFNPRRNNTDEFRKFYKSPMFPVVCSHKEAQDERYGYLGEVVRVKLTMEEDETK